MINRLFTYGVSAAITLALAILGALHFSQVTPEQARQIELEAGLEQLYLLERAHYEQHGRYFDPTDPQEGLDWPWMQGYEWEVRLGAETFWLVVRADLDADGRVGAWVIDQESSQIRSLMDD
ncbi:MAG: hypothetical protein ACI906_005336 [Candidatus Latescibacterota bacterium]|jgi:hypothetical protein